MKKTICFTLPGGPYEKIELVQYGRDNFRVTYGQDPAGKTRRTYSEAARALGAAIMHRQACEGLVDSREPGEA